MELKGKIIADKVDIKMYHGIADLAAKKIKRIAEELIPTFIIEESLSYFSDLEKYETCQNIKKFFEKNDTFVAKFSREEWFGTTAKKKQKQ